jgi:serine/threonine-protein kinase
MTAPRGARVPSSSSRLSSSRSAVTEGRFLPGALVASRYRIVALLGRGGMGEVYRADDLTLGQPVALKFLPESASDDETLERFRAEVRIARRISHPNVCRVYDIGEAADQIFLSMEYVDGEDLASLLRRIGRLPQDKGLEIARKLCAGLAAAHDKGVLHRDLKPSNIMIDGRGEVLIMDFGLAAIARDIHVGEIRSGTPAYMAPEQLDGREVTARSDVYALGLVLYEMFTGKRAFDGNTLEEITLLRRHHTPSRPSDRVRDLDPAIERVILRCLETDPLRRPATALAVAAALPGGDPLAAALAAGETPSPQLVAAAGERAGISKRGAVIAFAAAVAALIAAAVIATFVTVTNKIDAPYSAEVLDAKARDLVQQFGYTDAPADSYSAFDYDDALANYISQHPGNWRDTISHGPALLFFWYRQSPNPLAAIAAKDNSMISGLVTHDDPPPLLSGMLEVRLDPRGRLVYLQAIPPQVEKSNGAASAPNWDALFTAAGLDRSKLEPASPEWNSLGASDVRAAWTGTWPGTTRRLRVEAAAWHGKPVSFRLIGDWTEPERNVRPDSRGQKAQGFLGAGVAAVLLVFAVFLAYRNWVRRRSDQQGAMRLAVFVFALTMALWLCRAHFVPPIATLGLFFLAVAGALFNAALIWLLYVAAEPYVRRYWPQTIISWTRLLSGRVRDPLVGRDALIGVILGLTWLLLFDIYFILAQRAGDLPAVGSSAFLDGFRPTLGAWLLHVSEGIMGTLQFFVFLFVARMVLRRTWLAAVAFVAFWTIFKCLDAQHLAILVPVVIGLYSIAAIALVRFGFVTLAAAIFTVDLLANVPIPTSFSSWYIGSAVFVLASILALAAWGFHTALAGQPLWKESLD